jgi:ABC-type branched-subunit amino acid transport system ATPase component
MRIEQYSDEQAGTLPFGINRRVGIACTLPLRPSLILLDEPAAGLSNDETDDLAISLHAVQSRGQGICLVDHNMEFVSEFCRHIIVLDTGRNLTEGTPAQVMHDEQVARVYLGHAAER